MAGGKGEGIASARPAGTVAPAGGRAPRKSPGGARRAAEGGSGAAPRKQLDSLSHLQTKSSAFRGVSWSKHKQKWQSCIRIANRQFFLGRYADECEAARAYDRAAICYYSADQARTNFEVSQYEAELGTLKRMDITLYAATSQQHSRALTSHLRRVAQAAGKAGNSGGSPGAGGRGGAGRGPPPRKKKPGAGGGAGSPEITGWASPGAGGASGEGGAGAGGGAVGTGMQGVGSPSDFLAAAEERLKRLGQQGAVAAAGAGRGAGGSSPGAAKKAATKARTPKIGATGRSTKVAGSKRAKGASGGGRLAAAATKAAAAAAGAQLNHAAHPAAGGGLPPGIGALWDPLAQVGIGGGGSGVGAGGALFGAAVKAGVGGGLFPHPGAPPLGGPSAAPSLDDLSDDTHHVDPSEELRNLNSLFSGVMHQTGREQGDLREKQFDVLAGQDAVLGLQGTAKMELESVLRAEADALDLRDHLELQYRHNMQLWESSLLEFASEVAPNGAAPGQLPPMSR